MPSENGKIGSREFIVLMASLMSMTGLAIDLMLPALGTIARELHLVDNNHRQLVIGIFMLGMGVGCLIPGPLSDRFGRRPVLFVSMFFYIVPMVACALVTDFETLVFLRLIQAIGSGGLTVLPAAIIRDRFEGDMMARMQSIVAMVFMVVPVLAPSIGQVIIAFAGWRWVFGILAIYAGLISVWLWFRLPETHHKSLRQPINPSVIMVNMRNAVTLRSSVGYVLASAFATAGLWGFVNSSQQLIGEHFKAGHAFPLVFGALAMGMSLSSFINSRIVMLFGARRVSHVALLVYLASALGQTIVASGPHQTLLQFSFFMAINMTLAGFLGANFTSIALQPFARIAGSAASAHAFMRSVVAGIVGLTIGQAFDGTALPLAVGLLCCGMASLACILFSEQGRLFRRLNPPPN